MAGGVCYREALSPLARAFVLLMGVCMFVFPAFVVWKVRWSEPSAGTLVAALFVVVPVALGVVFLAMGLTAARQILFDARDRVLRITARGPLGQRQRTIPFTSVTEVRIERCKGIEDPDSFRLRLWVRGRRRPYLLGMLEREEEALRWQARLQALLRATG